MYGEADEKVMQPVSGCGPLLDNVPNLNKPLRQRVYEHVRAQGRAARSDISRSLAISPGSATTLTADLIQAGLLREVSQVERDAGRGRPRVALEIVPQAGFVIGMKLDDDEHTAVLSDFAGNIIVQANLASSLPSCSVTKVVDDVENLIRKLLKKSKLSMDRVRGIGVGMAGLIAHENGIVRWSPLLNARDQPLGATMQARFGRPVVLENDANMLTLSKLWFGPSRTKVDFAVVTIGSGVGMGLVLNNQLYRGSYGIGLELGHTKLHMDGALCRCGQRGCLEAYTADYALVREAVTALNVSMDDKINPQFVLDALFDAAASGDPAAHNIFRRAGRFLALGLSNLIHLFDPALIILSGDRATYDFMYDGDVRSEVQALSLSRGKMPCEVEVQPRDDLDWARGATARALTHVTDAMFTAELST